jgi:lycopene cyclase domain-containing protein
MTYSLLNAIFLAVAATLAVSVLRGRQWLTVTKVLLPMLLLTTVFDNLIIASGIVAYDPNNISGIKIGVAPIEDFGYTIAAALLMPTIWFFVEKRNK